MNKTMALVVLIMPIVFGLTGCNVLLDITSEPHYERPGGPGVVGPPPGNLHIPPGHLPPPGQCKIWYPGRPPGHQPSAGNCAELSRQVPPGAWLIHRDQNDKKHVRVSRYHPSEPGIVVTVRIYLYATGEFVSEYRPGR